MRRILILFVLAACTKAKPSEPPPMAGSAPPLTIDAAPPVIDAVEAAATVTDAVVLQPKTTDTRGVQLYEDPTPIPRGSNDPGAALANQLGGPTAPARGGRSLVVVKSKKALDTTSLSAGKVMHEYVMKGQASVKACFDALRAKDPAATGLLTLHFSVAVDGTLVDPKVEGFDPDIVRCVETAMRTWTFSKPDRPTRFELVLDLVIG